MKTRTTAITIGRIKRHNREAGFKFFALGNERFFNSCAEEAIYDGPGGIFLITSEQAEQASPRLSTVRQYNPQTGEVTTAGTFHKLARPQALKLARKLAKIK